MACDQSRSFLCHGNGYDNYTITAGFARNFSGLTHIYLRKYLHSGNWFLQPPVIFAAVHLQIRLNYFNKIWMNQRSQNQSYGGNA
jgi:hypothetical protein